MKVIMFIAFLTVAGLVSESCAQGSIDKPAMADGKQTVDVYYFHATRRCATCNAVEDQSKAALEKLYPQEMKSGTIAFHSVNFEEPEGEALGKKLNVPGQALLVVKGDQKTDLTSEGFMYARSAPEKLQNSLKKTIDPLL